MSSSPTLFRRLYPSLFLACVIAYSAISHRAFAATYTVTSATDPVPVNGVIGCDDITKLAAGTLRWAIVSANGGPANVVMSKNFAASVMLNSTCKTLHIRRDTKWSSREDFIVKGDSMGVGTSDLVEILNPAGGSTSLYDVHLDGGPNAGRRGIKVSQGDLFLFRSHVANNKSPSDALGYGAGILVQPLAGFPNLTLSRSLVEHNVADGVANASGGGIFFQGTGALTVGDSLIANNSALGAGAGIFLGTSGASTPAESRIHHSTVEGNQSGSHGGGIEVANTTTQIVWIEDATISDNTSAEQGAGLYVTTHSNVRLTDTTIAENVALDGGVSQLVMKSDALLYSQSSIISGAAPVCGGPQISLLTGPNNLWSDNTCVALFGLSSTNPLLGPLQNNLGSCNGPFFDCLTRKPDPASPAIGGSSACPLIDDQRHFARGAPPCWIGSYED